MSIIDSNERASSQRRTVIGMLIVALLFIITAAACGTSDPEPTATATPPPEPVAEGDLRWNEIQKQGQLVVGTSAGYPPFEFYDSQFQLEGLDIAIIEDIGRRLGLELDIRDMAFDGLGNALQVDQIDVAIAAISVNDDRRRVVDFSNTYYASSDALLASADAPFEQITNPREIARLRLGVESGTIYENYAQTELVETGLMPVGNLHVYKKAGDAIIDLVARRIDLVALDLLPAELAVEVSEVKLVAQGLNEQNFALAVPKGSNTLLAALNQALFDMQGDGTLTRLVVEYTGLEAEAIQPLPPAEPAPPSAPAPSIPGQCIDSSEYVADLSYDDANLTNIPLLAPGETFQKGWQMRNSGTCTWDNSYVLLPVDSNVPAGRLGGNVVAVQGSVAPGETYDFWADLVAPIDPGTYVGYWSMRNGQSGLLFGERVTAALEVGVVATPTPLPTQTPVPGIAFTATPEVIQQGACSTLTWATENIQAVYLYEQGEDWRNNSVPEDGSLSVCPLATTTYELRVVKNDGSVEIRTVTVFVTPNTAVPQITRFTVEPPDQIAAGQCVTVQWIVQGAVDSVSISRSGVTIWPNAPFSGAMQDCPPNTGQVVYGLIANGPGGRSQAQWVINVVPPSTSVPTSTPPPAAGTPTPSTEPVIYYFQAQPTQITTNSCVTLSWNVGGNASQVNILRNSVAIQQGVPFHSTWSDCSNGNVGTVIYSLVAKSNFNQATTEQASVNVMPG